MSADRKAEILILSSAIGSGHMRASAALTDGVRLTDPTRTCLTVDFPHEVSPVVEWMLRRAYLESLKLMPEAYGRIYRISELWTTSQERPQWATDAFGRMRRVTELWAARYENAEPGYVEEAHQRYPKKADIRALERLIAETGAQALVAPHFYGAGVLGNYKRENPQVFGAVILTDYVPHPIGVPTNLDLYLVADEEAADLVSRLGVPEDRIHATGIPIDPHFEEPADPDGVLRDLLDISRDSDDLPIVVVMGGGLGGGHLEEAVGWLLEASAAMHLVVLCGSNTTSRESLGKLARDRNRSASLLGFTDRVRDLMAAASVLVTKPGGMSCTEALASGLPQVLFNPIPGQEEDNAAAMVRYGAGVTVDDTSDILGETLKILTSSNHRTAMKEAALRAHRPNSARTAARLLLEKMP